MLVLKDVLRPHLKPISSGKGERVPARQVPYRQQQVLSKSRLYIRCKFYPSMSCYSHFIFSLKRSVFQNATKDIIFTWDTFV